MALEHDLPRLLREAGIATAEQAEALAAGVARVLAAQNQPWGATPENVRALIDT